MVRFAFGKLPLCAQGGHVAEQAGKDREAGASGTRASRHCVFVALAGRTLDHLIGKLEGEGWNPKRVHDVRRAESQRCRQGMRAHVPGIGPMKASGGTEAPGCGSASTSSSRLATHAHRVVPSW
jgi:hypothetical protein